MKEDGPDRSPPPPAEGSSHSPPGPLEAYRAWRSAHLDGPAAAFFLAATSAVLLAFILPNAITLHARMAVSGLPLPGAPAVGTTWRLLEYVVRLALVVPLAMMLTVVLRRIFPRPITPVTRNQALTLISLGVVGFSWLLALAVKATIALQTNRGFLVILPLEFALLLVLQERLTDESRLGHRLLLLGRFARESRSPLLRTLQRIPEAAVVASTVPGPAKWDLLGHLLDAVLTAFRWPPSAGALVYASPNEGWQGGIQRLIQRSRVVLVDVTEFSPAVQQEVLYAARARDPGQSMVVVAEGARFRREDWGGLLEHWTGDFPDLSYEVAPRRFGTAEVLLGAYALDLGTLALQRGSWALVHHDGESALETLLVLGGLGIVCLLFRRLRRTTSLTERSVDHLLAALRRG